MVNATSYYKEHKGHKIAYILINKDQADVLYINGFTNIFYSHPMIENLVGDALVLWMNYDDDKDQWRELDRLLGGIWFNLDDHAYNKLYGKTYEESKSKVSTTKPATTKSTTSISDTIPDPWDDSNRVETKTNNNNTYTTDTNFNAKPTAHKDTSGFRLGDWKDTSRFRLSDWDKATNLSKPTSSSDLPKDKVILPNYDDYIKEVQSYLKHQKPESEVKSNNGLSNDDLAALTDYIKSLHQQRYKLPKVEFKPIPDVKVTLSGVSDSKVTLKPTPFQQSLKVTLDSLYEMLSKNEQRSLERLTCFSNAKPDEVLRQLIDYKLTSIRNTATPSKQDVADLIGYLITYSIEQGWIYFNDK